MDRSAEAALRVFDKLLEERPKRVGHDFSEATRWTAAFRDALIVEWRRTESDVDRQRLNKVNAVLSVLLGCHYPLGEVPWPELEKARAQLASV